jgi:hypothetical protein
VYSVYDERVMEGTMESTQDVRVRDVPVELARQWKAAIAARGLTVRRWFLEAAEREAKAFERKMRGGAA